MALSLPSAGQHARGDQRAGDEADLALQGPAPAAVVEGVAGGQPGGDAAVEDADVAEAGLGEAPGGLAGAVARLADEHHRRADAAELVTVLPEGVERDVVGARDVPGLELGGGADVDEADVVAVGEARAQLDGGDGGVRGVLLGQWASATSALVVM